MIGGALLYDRHLKYARHIALQCYLYLTDRRPVQYMRIDQMMQRLRESTSPLCWLSHEAGKPPADDHLLIKLWILRSGPSKSYRRRRLGGNHALHKLHINVFLIRSYLPTAHLRMYASTS